MVSEEQLNSIKGIMHYFNEHVDKDVLLIEARLQNDHGDDLGSIIVGESSGDHYEWLPPRA